MQTKVCGTSQMSPVARRMWKLVLTLCCCLQAVQGCANTGGNNRREEYYQNQNKQSSTSKYRYVRSIDDEVRYTLHEEEVDWFAANDQCNKEGSHLVVVNSPQEAEKVARLLSADRRYHAGFQDLSQEGQYVTVTGFPLEQTGYMRWSAEEPSNGPGENCGSLDSSGLLADVGCHDKLYFICEAKSPVVPC